MRVPLLGAAYASESIISSAQVSINLYAEKNPGDSSPPVPVTTFQTPGLRPVGIPANVGPSRVEWTASNGDLYQVIGPNVYYVSSSFTYSLLGKIPDQPRPVSMADNGLVIILVDGTTTGYAIDINNRTFGRITDPSFLGADFVDYFDTYFIFNQPKTPYLYISLSNINYALLTQIGIATGVIQTGGTGYVNGVHKNVALTGGSGTGATADITVAGGIVTVVTLDSIGNNYAVNDVLSAPASALGGTGSGFTYDVLVVTAAFDPLDIAGKTGSSDNIQRVIICHRLAWPIGVLTSETWVDTGAADFALQPLPGAFIEHGCIAKYSIAKWDNSVFWLSQDRQGRAMVVMTSGFAAQGISTHGITTIFQEFGIISDAIGYMLQFKGHIWYCLAFPSADATYVYDLETKQWFRWASIDNNGALHRHRANGATYAYGLNIVGDWQTGQLYALDPDVFTDNGMPIPRVRSFPHMLNDQNIERVTYRSFIADMEVGNDDGALDQSTPKNPPMVSLRWSDDRGKTYGNPVQQSLGAAGQYLTSIKWSRLGMARDRIFELSWSAPMKTTLNGAFVDPLNHKS